MSMIAEIVAPPRRHGSTCAEAVYVEIVTGTFCSFPLSQGLRTGRRVDIVPTMTATSLLASGLGNQPFRSSVRFATGHTGAVHMAACIHA